MKELMVWALAAVLFLGVLGVAAFYEPPLPHSVPGAGDRAPEGASQAERGREEAALSSALREEQGEKVPMHPCRWEESCVALCGHGRELCCEVHWACPAPGASGWEQGPLAASTTRQR